MYEINVKYIKNNILTLYFLGKHRIEILMLMSKVTIQEL